MKISVEKHGETKNGVFWAQVRVGDLAILGRSTQADSFESFKRNFRFVFDPGDQSCEKLQELLNTETRSKLQQAVKRAWMKVKQPRVDYVRSDGEIVLKRSEHDGNRDRIQICNL